MLGSHLWSIKANCRGGFYYELKRDPQFGYMRERLIIDLGAGSINWDQPLANKAVLEIQAPGRRLPPFKDYLEFSLTHAQLNHLCAEEYAHRWRSVLSVVAGVYLILAEKTGHQYVGNAYGTSGIWGRWAHYANTGHGDNVKLQALIKKEPAEYPKHFRFSVPQILPRTMAKSEVIRRRHCTSRNSVQGQLA